MKIGTAQLEITPQSGIDLAGFAVRPQPSTGILDPLWIRALYLEDGAERILWLHADLLALDQQLADGLRRRVAAETTIPFSRVLLSTTHTHSGPGVIHLIGAGEILPAYVAGLEGKFSRVARAALGNLESCRLVIAHGRCELGRERRRTADPHSDPRVLALGWRRDDGTFKAVFLSYAMHPVCLRGSEISADWPGETARVLSGALPGSPVVLVASGACGNVNPPNVGVAPKQMQQWGRQIAESVLDQLLAPSANSLPESPLKFSAATVPLPREDWNVEQIEKYAAACLTDPAGRSEFGGCFTRAVGIWRDNMVAQFRRGDPSSIEARLSVISFGPTAIVTVNGEIFSHFVELFNSNSGCSVSVVGCTNGMVGYLAPAHAYAEGGMKSPGPCSFTTCRAREKRDLNCWGNAPTGSLTPPVGNRRRAFS
jgi:hypothetical protein